MRGFAISTISAFGLLAACAWAAPSDYFPLENGNEWIYRVNYPSGHDFVTVKVTGAKEANGNTYYHVDGQPIGDLWLRIADDGTVYALDEERQTAAVWAYFGGPQGSSYDTSADHCSPKATVQETSGKYSGPLGEFENAFLIVYPPAMCADAGLQQDVFLPGVGLVKRVAESFAGPRSFDLIYARLGAVTYISNSRLSFSLGLDRVVYSRQAGSKALTAEARMILTARENPITLVFADGQSFDLVVRSEKGDQVYRWSAGRAFTQTVRTEVVEGERNWALVAPLGDLPPGKYTARGWLTTMGDGHRFSATVSFEIR